MSTEPSRLPFDDHDAAAARRYLASRNFTLFDPFGAESATEDLVFTTSLDDARRIMEESFATHRVGGQNFRGYPVFVEGSPRNAFAVEYEGVQVCGIHVGLVSALFEICVFAFAQAAMFTEIGDASDECSPRLPEGSALSLLMSDRLRSGTVEAGAQVGAEFLPRDDQRQLAGQFLLQFMLRFVWLHELYHALNGHTGLVAERRQGTVLNEMPDDESVAVAEKAPDPVDPQWRLTLHCMEFDADRTAFWAMMRLQEEDAEPVPGLAALPKPLRLKLTVFGAIMMTFLFDQSARRQVSASSGTHPLPYHRLHNLVRTLASNLSDPAGTAKAAFNAALDEMARLKVCVPELFSPRQLLHDLRDADLQRDFDRVEESLTTTRKEFAPFAFR